MIILLYHADINKKTYLNHGVLQENEVMKIALGNGEVEGSV